METGIKEYCYADAVYYITDAVMLQKHLLDGGTLTDRTAEDLCEDDIIDIFGFVIMKKTLAV